MHQRRRTCSVFCVGAFVGLLFGAVDATGQNIRMNLPQMLAAAERVVVAEATDSRTEWVTTRSGQVMNTTVTFRVTSTLKGRSSMLLPLEFLGGVIDGAEQDEPELPVFDMGDRGVLFVSGSRASSPIVGHREGWFPITVSPNGIEHVTLHDDRAFSAVTQVGSPITVSAHPLPTMALEAFVAAINQLVFSQPESRMQAVIPINAARPASVDAGNADATNLLLLFGGEATSVIPFPPRDQSLLFFLDLEDTYRDEVGRTRNNQGFVNAEGSAVWFAEWLRYVLNYCSTTQATERVLMQIRGQGIQPVCGVVAAGAIEFPPRNLSLDFLDTLDTFYRDELNRTVELSYIDLEGKAVWLQDYLRYRVNYCNHSQASHRVLDQIRTLSTPGYTYTVPWLCADPAGPIAGFWSGTIFIPGAPRSFTLEFEGVKEKSDGSGTRYKSECRSFNYSGYGSASGTWDGANNFDIHVDFGDGKDDFDGEFDGPDKIIGTIKLHQYSGESYDWEMVRTDLYDPSTECPRPR